MSSIDTVVFDIGNVLIPWDPRWLYRKLLPDDEAIERFLREVDFQAWNLRHDAGQPFALGIAEHGDRFPHYRPLLQAYFDRFEESMGSAIAGTLALVRQLRASGYRTLALTNFFRGNLPAHAGTLSFPQRVRRHRRFRRRASGQTGPGNLPTVMLTLRRRAGAVGLHRRQCA